MSTCKLAVYLNVLRLAENKTADEMKKLKLANNGDDKNIAILQQTKMLVAIFVQENVLLGSTATSYKI
jgi:hypothetical protein